MNIISSVLTATLVLGVLYMALPPEPVSNHSLVATALQVNRAHKADRLPVVGREAPLRGNISE
jgi:hypothetical protein